MSRLDHSDCHGQHPSYSLHKQGREDEISWHNLRQMGFTAHNTGCLNVIDHFSVKDGGTSHLGSKWGAVAQLELSSGLLFPTFGGSSLC